MTALIALALVTVASTTLGAAQLGQPRGDVLRPAVDVVPGRPSWRASGSLSLPRAMATVSKPIRAANCTPRWPRPPMPRTADEVAGPRPAVAQRVEGGDPGAEQRPGLRVAELVRDARQRLRRGDHVLGVAAVEA